MPIFTRRNILHQIALASSGTFCQRAFACSALAFSGLDAYAGANLSPLRFSYQRSSTLLTLLKLNGGLAQRLAPENLDPNWFLFTAVLPPMTGGSVDFHADVADAVLIYTQAAGAKLTLYAQEEPSPSAEAIIVRQSSPIATIADLKGRKVGVSKGSGCHFLLIAAARKSGLHFKDIQPVYLEAPEGMAAFQRGSIDAWAIWDPFLAIAEAQIPCRTLTDGRGLTSYRRYYTVNNEIAERKPDLVRHVFDALAETSRFVHENPEETAKLLATVWGDLPLPIIETVNRRRSYSVKPVDPENLDEEQRIADAFFDAGLIPASLKMRETRIWRP